MPAKNPAMQAICLAVLLLAVLLWLVRQRRWKAVGSNQWSMVGSEAGAEVGCAFSCHWPAPA